MNRRTFIKKSALISTGSLMFPLFSIGKPGQSANNKLNYVIIGSGGIGKMTLGGSKSENLLGICDIDSNRMYEYAKKFPILKKVPAFTDYRKMFDKLGDQIDAVCINTPDHTHFVITLEAMERGYHVCTQKPLTHNIWEARTLRKAKAKYNVVTCMANQGHTYKGIRTAREMYEAGILGQVNLVESSFNGPNWKKKFFKKPSSYPVPTQRIPANVDWDLWLGPSTANFEYNEIFHPLTWRGFWDFGSGQLGDWFPHICDAPVWALDLYEPTVIECESKEADNDMIIPNHSTVRWDFPARGDKEPCSLRWYDGFLNGGTKLPTPGNWNWGKKKPEDGSFWYGKENTLYTDQRSNNPRLSDREAMKALKKDGMPAQKYERVEGGPYQEFYRAIKGEGAEPGSNFDYAAKLTEVQLLGCLAQRFGGKIEWDAKNMKITNRPELNAFIKEPVRSGWEYGEDLWS